MGSVPSLAMFSNVKGNAPSPLGETTPRSNPGTIYIDSRSGPKTGRMARCTASGS